MTIKIILNSGFIWIQQGTTTRRRIPKWNHNSATRNCSKNLKIRLRTNSSFQRCLLMYTTRSGTTTLGTVINSHPAHFMLHSRFGVIKNIRQLTFSNQQTCSLRSLLILIQIRKIQSVLSMLQRKWNVFFTRRTVRMRRFVENALLILQWKV